MKKDISVSDPLDKAILEQIQTVPTIWQRYESDALTSTQQKALALLLAAELIEQRRSIKLREIGNPDSKIVLATFRATGEYGLVEVTDKLAAAVPDWVDSEGKLNNQVLCEHEPVFQMRLTDQGELAHKDLADGESARVLDWVKKTNFFTNREPVRGQGIVESLDIQNPPTSQPVIAAAAAPASNGNIQIINQINNDTLAEAITKAVEKLSEQSKPSEEKEEVHRPGPERLTLHEAEERVRILRKWADQQDINMDDRHSKMSLAEFAERNNTTAKKVSNYQSWYRKYRKRGTLPTDPRQVPPSKLKQLFG